MTAKDFFYGAQTTRDSYNMESRSMVEFIKTVNSIDKLIVKPSVPSISILEGTPVTREETTVLANQFVRNFVTEKNNNVSAAIIQRSFRLYKIKKHYKTFIGLRIKYHRRIQKVLFNAWRAYSSKNIVGMHYSYEKFVEAIQEIHFICQYRDHSNFRYFYVTNQLFLPIGYEQERTMQVVKNTHRTVEKRIFRLWHRTAHKAVVHKTSLNFINYTASKFTFFGGPIVFAYFNWSRYTKWKKIADANPPLSMPEVVLQVEDPIPKWTVVQSRKNAERHFEVLADQNALKKLKERASKALNNYAKRQIRHRQVIKNLGALVGQHTFMTAYKAWKRFVDSNRDRIEHERNLLRGWYKYAFAKARTKMIIQFNKERGNQILFQRIINRWCFVARRLSIKKLESRINIQNKASLAMEVILLLQNKYTQYLHVAAFRAWIRYSKERVAFKKFCKFSQNVDRNRELKFAALSAFRTASEGDESIIPRGLGFSLDMDCDVLLSTLEYKDSQRARDKVDYDGGANNDPQETLVRSLILALHGQNQYDVSLSPAEDRFVKYRSEEDLLELIDTNASILRKNLRQKLLRERVLLLAYEAHEEAIGLNSNKPEFSVRDGPNVEGIVPSEIDESQKVTTFAEVSESIDALVKLLDQSPPRIMSTAREMREKAFDDFANRLREPIDAQLEADKIRNMLPFSSQTLSDDLLKMIQDEIPVKPHIVPRTQPSRSSLEKVGRAPLKPRKKQKPKPPMADVETQTDPAEVTPPQSPRTDNHRSTAEPSVLAEGSGVTIVIGDRVVADSEKEDSEKESPKEDENIKKEDETKQNLESPENTEKEISLPTEPSDHRSPRRLRPNNE